MWHIAATESFKLLSFNLDYAAIMILMRLRPKILVT